MKHLGVILTLLTVLLGLPQMALADVSGTYLAGLNITTNGESINAGNLIFNTTGQLITGDMSNATIASRIGFQSSTTNGNTAPIVLPNGAATLSQILLLNNSTVTSAGAAKIGADAGGAFLDGSNTGGSTVPTQLRNGGTAYLTIPTTGGVLINSGNLGVNTASPVAQTHIVGGAPQTGTGNVSFTNGNSTATFSSSNATSVLHVGDILSGTTVAGIIVKITDGTHAVLEGAATATEGPEAWTYEQPSFRDDSQPGTSLYSIDYNGIMRPRRSVNGAFLIGEAYNGVNANILLARTAATAIGNGPSAIGAGGTIGALQFQGDDGTSMRAGSGVSIAAVSDNAWTTSDHSANLVFQTDLPGTTALSTRMQMGTNGQGIGIGGADAAGRFLYVTGTMNATGAISRGIEVAGTYVAQATSDVLAGEVVGPTFSLNSQTGISNLGIQIVPAFTGTAGTTQNVGLFVNGWSATAGSNYGIEATVPTGAAGSNVGVIVNGSTASASYSFYSTAGTSAFLGAGTNNVGIGVYANLVAQRTGTGTNAATSEAALIGDWNAGTGVNMTNIEGLYARVAPNITASTTTTRAAAIYGAAVGATVNAGATLSNYDTLYLETPGGGSVNRVIDSAVGFAVDTSGNVFSPATVAAAKNTAVTAGGSTVSALNVSSAASPMGIYFGSGAPTISAPQGSFYMRTDGSSTSTRAYINTNGSTGWTAITTAS